ncbi:YciI family protein [Kribbella sp. CA-293567]|uniref:YciI family protein n=1 Tax=Kribbella sp. CA-293567 TaxID=3002436 RepID=UPI0022DD8BBE|nr:YciI family protein [Kribbella sp. CA-293567]WBQ04110.1 YciI family protein [Kribbella sp. CA-293567]
MRYMMTFRGTEEYENGAMPSEESITAMTALMAEMAEQGVLIGGDGLHPSSQAVRLEVRDGKPRVLDGPFAETKELIAGYALIQVASKEEAIAWASRCLEADMGNSRGVDLRLIFEADDFGDAYTPEARARSREADANISS